MPNIPTTVLAKQAITATTTSPFKKLKGSSGNISLQMVTDGSLVCTWKVLGSNKADADVNGDPDAVDISAAFKDAGNNAIAAVTGAADATQQQGVQAGPIWFGAIAVKNVYASGAGNAAAYLNEAT